MTTMRYVSIACDVCGDEIGPNPTARELRAMFDRLGWERRRLSGRMADLCRVCARKPNDELVWWDKP